MESVRRRVAMVAGVLALGSVVQAGAARAADPIRISTPSRMTTDADPTRTYGSPYVLVDPHNRLNVVAATVEMRTQVCSLFRSADGGQTWKKLDALPGPRDYPFCFQPSGSVTESPMAWGRNGTLYYALVGWDVSDGGDTSGNLSTLVARSTNLGTSWTTTVARNNRGKTGTDIETDRPVSGLAVDSSGPQDVVYVTYRRNLSGQPVRPVVATSTDGGKTFGDPVDMEDAWAKDPKNITGTIPDDKKLPANMTGFNPIATTDNKGTLYVMWERRTSNITPTPNFAYYVSKSTDHGKTFTTYEAFPETPNLAGGFITWSKQGGAQGTLLAAWHAKPGQTQGETDIYFRRSLDGGKTWSEAKRLNDDDPAKFNTQLLPDLSVAPNGRIDAVWWDFRDDPGLYVNDVYYTYSTDDGVTWAKNIRITDQSVNRKIGPWSNGFDMRQPPGVASTNDYAIIAWDDTRNGDTVGQAQDMYSATAQFKTLTSGTPNAVRYVLSALGGVAVVGVILLIVATTRRRKTPAAASTTTRPPVPAK
ncbi:MAG TPA: sialidase family protein [Acidimicrobiales bacterium]|nr:sialidase family protein [Acidimicrobiales bacterium]